MIDLDKLNHRILRILAKDGRISNSDLADKVGLSASACLRRVQELERKGVISGYKATLNQSLLGGGVTVFVTVGLNEHRSATAREFEDAITLAPQVRECHNVTGSIEYLLRVEVADLAAYKKFHADTLGALSQVSSITSHICLGSPKDERA